MKHIVLVPFLRTTSPGAKLQISFTNDLVHLSRIYFLACLVMWRYSIASPISSYMISSAYPDRIVCSDVFIFIAYSKRLGAFFLIALLHGALVLLAFLIVKQVTFPCRYGIFAYFLVGTWSLDYSWCLSFLVCRCNCPCCCLHPSIWSGFYRRVGIVVFNVVRFCPSPPLEIPLSSPSENCMCQGLHFNPVWVWVYSILFYWSHLSPIEGGLLVWAVCWWMGWTVGKFWCSLCHTVFHPWIWLCLTPIHFILFIKILTSPCKATRFL